MGSTFASLRPSAAGLFFPGLRDLMGYDAQARDFIACLTDPKRAPRSGFAQAQRDLNIVFQAYRGLSGETVMSEAEKIIYSMRNVSKHYNRKKSSKTFRCPTFTAPKLACSV